MDHHYSNLSNRRQKRLSQNKNKHNHVRRKTMLCLLIKSSSGGEMLVRGERWECWWRPGDQETRQTKCNIDIETPAAR